MKEIDLNTAVVAIHGDPERARHLFSIHYAKLISLDYRGNIDLSMQYK